MRRGRLLGLGGLSYWFQETWKERLLIFFAFSGLNHSLAFLFFVSSALEVIAAVIAEVIAEEFAEVTVVVVVVAAVVVVVVVVVAAAAVVVVAAAAVVVVVVS